MLTRQVNSNLKNSSTPTTNWGERKALIYLNQSSGGVGHEQVD